MKRKEAEERRKEATEKAFAEWVQAKGLSEQAARFLLAVDSPDSLLQLEEEEGGGARKAEQHWMVGSSSSIERQHHPPLTHGPASHRQRAVVVGLGGEAAPRVG